jgi:hypothetical protein
MMAREPAHRFQTPADVALALAPFTDRAALQSAQQAQHFVQETPTQPAIIGADTDDTLQGFINQLANKAVDEPSSPPRASSVRPAPAPQSSGSADDGSKSRPNSIGIAGAPFGILAVGVLVVAFFPRGERTVPQPQPKFVTETFVDGDGSGKTSRTDDRSVAFWVLSIDGSVELSVRGQKAYYKVLPEGKFVVAGIKLFNNAQVSDADLKQLAALKSLETLTLRGTQITSDGLSQLSQLKSLRQLNIADTEVDDAGLEHLRGLSKLEELTLPAGSVSPAAVRKLQTALRDCRISRE